MKTRYLLIALLLFSDLTVMAAQNPVSLRSDARIRTVTYRSDNVVILRAAYSFPTVIQFAKYENILGVFPGDSSAWHIIKAGNNRLILKPVIRPASNGEDTVDTSIDTNLFVVTSSGRDYHFDLIVNQSQNRKDMVYKVKFSYPDDLLQDALLKESKRDQITQSLVGKESHAKPPSAWNLDYSYSGSRSILPTRVFDDGHFTYFEFKENQEIPAVFYVHPDSRESLVNSRREGKYLVVERTGGQFTFRAGKHVACIFNEPYLKAYKISQKRNNKSNTNKKKNKKKVSSRINVQPNPDKGQGLK